MLANSNYFGIGQGKRPAPETLSLGLTSRPDQFSYNNLNQLVNLNSGGPLRSSGDVSKAMQSVSITAPVVNISANLASLFNKLVKALAIVAYVSLLVTV